MLSTPAGLLVRGCWFLVSLCVATACALAQPASGSRPTMPGSVLTSYRTMPVRLCVPVKAADWPALQSGRTRLILHLQNQAPSSVYSPTFQVSLLDPAAGRRVPIDSLAMQPDNPAAAGGLPGPQNFAIDLRGHLPAAIDRSTLCVEVAIDLGENGAAAGKASHPLRAWATLEPIGSQSQPANPPARPPHP